MSATSSSIVFKFRDFVDKHKDIDNKNEIISYDGTRFRRRKFESEFHRKIDRELHDPEKAETIANSFTRHFGTILNGDDFRKLENWILTNVRYLGFFPFESYWKGVLEEPIASFFSKYPDHFKAFFEDLRCAELPSNFPLMRNPNDPLNIVIITTTGGGGHKSVADALAQILNQYPLKYRVSVVDIASISKSSDPVYLASGLLTAEEVYDKIYQQEKETYLANQIWELKPKLNDFISDTCMKDLKDRIRMLNPDLIISTCHFWERDLDVASSLCVPLRFVHCDYELSWALLPVVAKANPQVIKLWLPATDPEILHPASSKLKSELVSQLRLSHSEKEIDELLQDKLDAAIDYSGYPVRKSFKRKEELNVLQTLRERFEVQKDAQVVTVQMGKQGVGDIFKVVKILNENRSVSYSRPLHLAVMCGTNEKMRQELLEYLSTTQNNPQIHFEILPFMDEETSADYLNITDVELMKPGGASTAEALKMRVRTLFKVMEDHPWEKCNGKQMVRHHVGEEVESLEKLPVKLKAMLEKADQINYIPIPAEDVVPKLVDEAVKVFDLYHQNNISTDAVFQRTSSEIVLQIYDMLNALDEILTKNNITYWMDGGTILGAVRNRGLIPWDDDGDLEIFEKDKEKLLSLAKEFEKKGYVLVDHEFGLKLFPKNGYFPSIDIFSVVEDTADPGVERYVLANEKARAEWPKEYWTKEELSSIVPYAFGPIKLMGCKETDRYLTTLYGKGYNQVAYQIWDHGKNQMHSRQAVRIVDRGPATFQENKA